MNKLYAGIGARDIPTQCQDVLTGISRKLASYEFVLRSGGAKGSDKAFEMGANYREIFTPSNNIKDDAYVVAKHFHPAWERLSPYVKTLMARNVHILFGENLNEPVSFIICWTQSGKATGGTGHSLRVAEAYNIPIFNISNGRGGIDVHVLSNLEAFIKHNYMI